MARLFRRQILILALLLAGVVMVVSVASADDVETIFITGEIDTGAFPDVSLTFRAVDSDNNAPDILTNDDIVVFENGQAVTDFEISAPVDGPVTVIFVIDLGQSANFRGAMADAVRDSMLRFTDGFFRDEIDTVAVMARRVGDGVDETVTLLEPTQSAAQFTSTVNTLNFQPTGRTEGLQGVESALNRMSRLVQPGHAGAAIIYISRLVEWPQQSVAAREARTLAAAAREQFTKLYSFHTDTNYGEPLQALATQSGGEYAQLSADRDNSGVLDNVYRSIMTQGTTYTLNYRSRVGDSGPRAVVVAPAGTPAEMAINTQTYNVSLQPPVIEMQAPEDNAEYTRIASRTGQDTWDYDLDSIAVTAELTSWPDGFQRNVERVEFVVGDVVRHAVENPASDTFSFNLDISEIEEPESLTIHVQVRDELGIEAESDSITVNIAIDRDEDVTVVVLPTQTPPPPPTPIVINEDPCARNPNSAECVQDRALTYTPWGLVIILSVVLLIYRQKVVAVAGAAGGALRDRVAEVRKTILGGGTRGKKVLAKLQVMVARRDLEGNVIKIHNKRTTIGRNPKLCDVQLYDEDEVSSISGQHCTIQYDRGVFLITDDNSVNGTEVNGVLLHPNSPRKLEHGDEIVLGDLFRRGAKLRFEIVESPAEEEQIDESNVTIVDDEFAQPVAAGAGSETILDLSDEGHSTLTEGEYGDSDVGTEELSDDWLSDLE